MTKKHFKAIADILKATNPGSITGSDWQVWRDIRDDLMDYFQRENPNFDRARFIAACEN